MSNLTRDMVFMILQFLREEKLEETLHQLESESGYFFNLRYFEQKFLAGDWDEVETYLSGFTKLEDNRSSMQLFFEIRKQKYIEALDNPDKDKAMEILRNELEVFSSVNKEVYNELSSLLFLENFRQHRNLSSYTDAGSARRNVIVKLKKLLETNPILQNKLQFPSLQQSHLQVILNQTLNPSALPTNAPLVIREEDIKPKKEELMEHEQVITSSENTQQNPWSLDDLPRVIVCTLNRDSDVTSLDFHPSRQTILAAGYKNGEVTLWGLSQREILMSKPFKIQDISTCSRVFQDTIRRNHSSISVTRVSWCPDGAFIGVAFKRHLVHLYTFEGSNDLQMYLEIDAHNGAVNDLAFCYPMRHLALVTCGDDKLIKVWDMAGEKLFNFEGHTAPVYSVCPHQRGNDRFIVSAAVDGQIKVWWYGEDQSRVEYNTPGQWFGRLLYNSEGNRLFSGGTSKDGWSYLVEWDERERSIKRTYSRFRSRTRGILQFDISKNRYLAAGEDNQIKFWAMDDVAFIAATFAHGGLPSLPLVRFNKEGNLLAVTTADGGFKVLANGDGLRSVSSSTGTCSHGPSNAVAVTQASSSSGTGNVRPNFNIEEGSSSARPAPNLVKVDPIISNRRRSELWPLGEYVHPSQCLTATLPDSFDSSTKVVCLIYNYAGTGILALGSNGLLKLWKWARNDQNPEGKPTAAIVPVLWRPRSGLLMNNDVTRNTEEAIPFIAITRNDDYLMSASGGEVSLFSTRSFKVVETYRAHSSVVTQVAFHILDNNIMALGMEDSTISIYNIKFNQLICRLEGHQKPITGLTFSIFVGLLVSSGADAQLWLWDIISWGKGERVPLVLPAGTPPTGITRVEFLHGGALLLVTHETQIAIFDPSAMEWSCRWMPQHILPAPISSASSSASGKHIYAAFNDGNIGVFETNSLKLISCISRYAYNISPTSRNVYPLVIAAHPDVENQVAVGLSDGSVKVIEPSESQRN